MQTPTPRPLVSVIVVCRNAGDVLGRCVEQLLAQDYPAVEIIVVDDDSDDDTVAVAQAAATYGELTLVRSDRHRGCPCARNLGVRHASGEILAFIDADGFATPSWVSELVRMFASDPGIGGVASTVFYDDNPVVINGAGGTVNRQGWAADLAMNQSYEAARLAVEALYPMGCGMAIRREALERVGPFDDRMLNYYDDVDYGTRLWRAGYTVVVAADAWVDHAAAGGDSAYKRLLCERHRMRVVLKHAAAGTLWRWIAFEARSLRAAPWPVRVQKLKAIAWNASRLSSAVASRRRLHAAPPVPERLIDDSWGDGFPVGVPPRPRVAPERARASLDMAEEDADSLLPYGWFPAEQSEGRSIRWAGASASAIVCLHKPARRLHLEYVHVPVDSGDVEVSIRSLGEADPLATIWQTRLRWQDVVRPVENHPVALTPGDYEVLFRADRGWTDPPRETRTLAFALARLLLAESFEIAEGGLEMGSSEAEQLVEGWYELERSPERAYRWAGDRAAAVVRLAAPARAAGIRYRLPPVANGGLTLTVEPLREPGSEPFSIRVPWLDGEWHEESFVVDLPRGEHLVSFATESAWSNPEGRDASLWPENRSLGLAISSLTFS